MYQQIKRKYSGNTFHVTIIVFCKNNMWKFKPKYMCEIFVAIFGYNFLTYNYLLKWKLLTYKKIIRVLLQFSSNLKSNVIYLKNSFFQRK